MKNQPLMKKLHKPVHPMITTAVVIGVIAVAAVLTLLLQDSHTQPPPSQPYQTSSQPTRHATTPTPPESIQHTFTSPDLGISFDYVDTASQPIQVKEVGDKVYLNTGGEQPPLGKYVEVFSKNPSDTLAQAIQKAAMRGYSLENCQITQVNLDKRFLNPTFQYAQIKVPGSDKLDLAQREDKVVQNCPTKYTIINSIKYFATDTQYPSKLVFFDLGQDNFGGKLPIDGSDLGPGWDETIRFINN